MNYLHWLFVLMAVFSAVPACTLISPWRVPARAIPMIMIVTALVVSFLPEHAILAMACVGPVAYLYKIFGIEAAENEPADYSKAAGKIRGASQAARTRLQELRTKPEPVEITEFVTKAYPAPGEPDAAELVHADATAIEDDDVDDEPELSAAEQMREKLESLTRDPALPRNGQQRLLGQRPGKVSQPGLPSLRNSASRVPQFVPSL